MQVYVVMNAYGISSMFGKKTQAEKRINYLHSQYEMNYWIVVWEVEGEDDLTNFGMDEDNDTQ